MNNQKLLTLLCFLFLHNWTFAQCPPGEDELRLEINADIYWEEVKWTIKDLETGFQYAAGSLTDSETHEYTYCIPVGCKQFSIIDTYGDGMAPDGYYRLYLNGVLIHENIGGYYGPGETTNYGCPPGSSCESAFPIDTGSWATPDGSQTWYRFVPAENGIYQINTCHPLNACGSKIWVYGQCNNIVLSDDLTGADFYAEDGCDNGALATLFLGGGEDYYIRMRYEPANCDTIPLNFTLSFVGPIVGCTDPTACNYNPLASVSDTCIYPGDPDCPQAPDLVTRQDVLLSSLEFTSLNNPDACAVEEGCLRGLGTRDIIRFTTYIENQGDADYYIGPSPDDITTPSTQFVWDPCHNHWHYLGYADYILFDANGLRIPIGSKTGFCVLDLVCGPNANAQYGCVDMGISAGCGDIYDASLPCQWIDITDLPAGDYTLVLRVNWDKSPDLTGRVEANYDNNWAQACFNLSYSGGNPDVVFNVNDCPAYTDCAGEVFGNAQPDCNGVCNGPALHGDIDQDTTRNQVDMEQYLAFANSDSGDASACFDLDGNGLINLYDEALLQECVVHQDDPQYWIQRFPCQFPGGFFNQQDLVVIRAASIDTVSKTFDLEIINPFSKLLGYEFNVSGLVIDSVENLMPNYSPNLRFNAASGEIIGMGLNELPIKKNTLPAEFLRVHYSELTDTAICVSAITAVVNEKYQLSNASVGNPSCLTVIVSSIRDIDAPFGVYVQPNPFSGHTTVFFENESAEPMTVTLSDITGKVIRSFEGVRDNSVTFERGNLEAGTYFFTVSGSKGRVTGKVMAQ